MGFAPLHHNDLPSEYNARERMLRKIPTGVAKMTLIYLKKVVTEISEQQKAAAEGGDADVDATYRIDLQDPGTELYVTSIYAALDYLFMLAFEFDPKTMSMTFSSKALQARLTGRKNHDLHAQEAFNGPLFLEEMAAAEAWHADFLKQIRAQEETLKSRTDGRGLAKEVKEIMRSVSMGNLKDDESRQSFRRASVKADQEEEEKEKKGEVVGDVELRLLMETVRYIVGDPRSKDDVRFETDKMKDHMKRAQAMRKRMDDY